MLISILPCQSHACRAIYGHYKKTYKDLIEEREQSGLLSKENDAMRSAHATLQSEIAELEWTQSKLLFDEKDALRREHARETQFLKSRIAELEFLLECETKPGEVECARRVESFHADQCAELQQELEVAQKETKDERLRARVLRDDKARLRDELEHAKRAASGATKEKELYKARADTAEGLLNEAMFISRPEGENQPVKRKIEEVSVGPVWYHLERQLEETKRAEVAEEVRRNCQPVKREMVEGLVPLEAAAA